MTHAIAIGALLVSLAAVLVAWRALTLASASSPVPPPPPQAGTPPPSASAPLEAPAPATDPALWVRIEALESRVATQEVRVASMPAGASHVETQGPQAGAPPPRPFAAYP
jgi:hypothetical protein